jgi:hypothetical protein
MIFVGFVANSNFFVYAQEDMRQDFTVTDEYLSGMSQESTFAVQPLQYFPTIVTPAPQLLLSSSQQTYFQQSPPPPSSPIQNVQLNQQQQVTVEICSNGIDDDRDGIVDEVVGCIRSQTTIQQQQQQIFPIPPQQSPTQQRLPIPQCEVYTLTVEGTSNLAKAKENIDSNTDLTFEISSILVPYDRYRIDNELVSGKLWIDKDKANEKELSFHIKEITNDCKLIAYLDDDDNNDNH